MTTFTQAAFVPAFSRTELLVPGRAYSLSVLTLDATTIEDATGSLVLDVVQAAVVALRELRSPSARVAIDIRSNARASASSGQDAVVEALRGLVQGYVAESGADVGSVNLIVTSPDQELDRESTWQFLVHPEGSFARGATFDLREE